MTRPTRRQLLRRGAAGAAGALVVPAAAATAAAAGTTTGSKGDRMPLPQRLGRLIEIEMLLLFCYEHILGSGILTPRAQSTLRPFVAHEEAHIAALTRQMRIYGGTVPAPPADVRAANRDLAHRKIGGRLGQLKGDLDALRLLLTTEQVTIGAYFVALRTITQPDLIELVCQMMANDAQHDSMIGLLLPPNKPGSAAPYGLVQGLQ